MALRALHTSSETIQRAKETLQTKVAEAVAGAEQAQRAVIQSQRLEAIGQLTGGVAHDFNNLLMVVSSNAHLLGARHGVKETDEMARIHKAVASGAKLTRQLLSFTRRQPLSSEVVDARRVLGDTLDLVSPTLLKHVRTELDCSEESLYIRVDSSEFELALINLAMNARDAMPNGGLLKFSARLTPDGNRVIVEVADTGVGMPPEVSRRAFEPFFTTKPVGHGTGLGLSQVYGFVTQMGGRLELDSQVGRGTIARLELPRSPAPSEAPASPSMLSLPIDKTGEVLLVEDNDEVATSTTEVLTHAGFKVTRAATADLALDLLKTRKWAAMLSDIRMPGSVDGMGLAKWVTARMPDLPVVLMTGYSEEQEHAVRLGLTVLAKPFAPDELVRELTAARLRNPRI